MKEFEANEPKQVSKLTEQVDSIFLNEQRKPLPIFQLLKLHRMSGFLSDSDYHVACFFGSETSIDDLARFNLIVLVAARLSFEINRQNTCFVLEQLLQGEWMEFSTLSLPDVSKWHELISDTSTENELSPIIIHQERVYFSRYFRKEKLIAEFFVKGIKAQPAHHWLPVDVMRGTNEKVLKLFAKDTVDSKFDPSNNEVDWQCHAVFNSLCHRFSVITGGPGTGKTTTVIKLLASLVDIYQDQPELVKKQVGKLSIQLAAPTGKAALRLTQSILKGLSSLKAEDSVKSHIPTEASTLHRLLKPLGPNEFYYNENNKLPLDVLVLDEASMIDISLMSKLVEALPSQAQLVLIGDKLQLASVEAGNILAELCSPLENMSDAEQNQRLHITELKRSYRFDAAGTIGLFAKAINTGHAVAAEHLLIENCIGNDSESKAFYRNSTKGMFWLNTYEHDFNVILDRAVDHFSTLNQIIDTVDLDNESDVIKKAFEHLYRFQILACTRLGQYGVETINDAIKQRLSRKGLVNWRDEHYAGRPILITENAYHLGLFNGDIGIQVLDPESGQVLTYFEDATGTIIKLFNQRLPKHESVYAMTVHKSQGSEFSHTVLMLPDVSEAGRGLTRELIYTAVTRSIDLFSLFGDKSLVMKATKSKTSRQSGLRDFMEDSGIS